MDRTAETQGKIRFTIWAIPCIIVSSVLWRRSEAAVTRRTRNAFIGSSRYEGSNPSVSAGKPLRNQGLLLFVLHFVLHSFEVFIYYIIDFYPLIAKCVGVNPLHHGICFPSSALHCVFFWYIQFGHDRCI